MRAEQVRPVHVPHLLTGVVEVLLHLGEGLLELLEDGPPVIGILGSHLDQERGLLEGGIHLADGLHTAAQPLDLREDLLGLLLVVPERGIVLEGAQLVETSALRRVVKDPP